ncbi:VOC family protein [bacterium]|nr:VOC family protein [bacterium]
MKINHLAIAVSDIEQSCALWSKVLQMDKPEVHILDDSGVIACPFETENLIIELIQPIDKNSPIWKFVHEKGGGLHHVALESDDIESDIEIGKSNGFRFLGDNPVEGLNDTKVIFMHPKSLGVLVELVQVKNS